MWRCSVNIGGNITGNVNIGGVLKGDLDAPNLFADLPLPSNVSIGCGIGTSGTISGGEPVCAAGNLNSSAASPPHGTRDGRQPYPGGIEGTAVALSERQGIGSPNPDARPEDKITMTLTSTDSPPLNAMRAISHDCWSLCETNIEPVDTGTPIPSPNKISCIHEVSTSGSAYEIKLERPISAKNWTRFRYVPGASKVFYASLPGNINNDNYVNSTDLLWRIDCMNGITSHCGNTVYTQDLNHDGVYSVATDYGLTWIDLWNGAGRFIPWQMTTLSPNTCAGGGGGGGGPICTSDPCGPDPGPQMAMSGGGEGSMEPQSLEMSGEENIGEEALVGELLEEEPSLAEQNATLADWLMNFLATANPESSEALETFDASMELIVQWCLDNFSDEEKTALIQRLNEPGFSFASAIGQEAAANLVTALGQ